VPEQWIQNQLLTSGVSEFYPIASRLYAFSTECASRVCLYSAQKASTFSRISICSNSVPLDTVIGSAQTQQPAGLLTEARTAFPGPFTSRISKYTPAHSR